MKCRKCGEAVRLGQRFCESCGARPISPAPNAVRRLIRTPGSAAPAARPFSKARKHPPRGKIHRPRNARAPQRMESGGSSRFCLLMSLVQPHSPDDWTPRHSVMCFARIRAFATTASPATAETLTSISATGQRLFSGTRRRTTTMPSAGSGRRSASLPACAGSAKHAERRVKQASKRASGSIRASWSSAQWMPVAET